MFARESLFGSLKVERLLGGRFVTRRHAKDETVAWLLSYNQSRFNSTLSYVNPVQFEATPAGRSGKNNVSS